MMNPNAPTSSSPVLYPYPLVQVIKKSNPGSIFYQFTTDYNYEFELVFKPDKDYLLEFPLISDLAYSFILERMWATNKPWLKGGANDSRVKDTIIFALLAAFEGNPDLIISYQCSTENDKQRARSRMFLRRFMNYGNGFAITEYTNESDVFAAALFRQGHPQSGLISHVFTTVFVDK